MTRPPMTDHQRGLLIAHADDVAHSLIEKWGTAVVGEPKYTEELSWHIDVVGVFGDIEMDTIRVFPFGSRIRIS